MKKTYQIGGMSCSACASAVERILKRMDGVTSAQVNLVLEEVVVEGEDLPAFADMQKAVAFFSSLCSSPLFLKDVPDMAHNLYFRQLWRL